MGISRGISEAPREAQFTIDPLHEQGLGHGASAGHPSPIDNSSMPIN